MRIPSSTIVMTVVAAVPFGLAIRDTVLHHDRLGQLELDRKAAAAELVAEQQHAAAEEAEASARLARETAARDKARRERAHELLGGFAAPGPAFAPLQLGAPVPIENHNEAALTVDSHGNVIEMASAPVDDDEGCSTLADVAVHEWGEPAHDHVWLDLDAHRRAMITPDCEVVFAQFDEPIAWVRQLPLDAIGGSRAALAKRFATPDADPDAAWPMPGLDGDELTAMWPVYDVARPDKLVGLQISTTATRATAQHVIEALSARLGAKPAHGDDDSYHWKSVRVGLAGNKLLVVLGADEP